MKTLFLTCICCLVSLTILGQNLSDFAGAKSQAFSGAAVCVTDVWSAHQNVAASAFVTDYSFGVSHQSRFLVKEFALSHAAFVAPTSIGNFNLAASFFGFTQANETKIGAGYARKFGQIVSVGIQVNYQSFFVQEASEQSNLITAEAGFIVKPISRLSIGVHVFNINQARLGDALFEQIPVRGKLGLLYEVTDELNLLAEVRKPIGFDEQYAVGLEYELAQTVLLRTGVSFPTALSNSFGLGLRFTSFSADFAYAYRSDLGSTASASIQYQF